MQTDTSQLKRHEPTEAMTTRDKLNACGLTTENAGQYRKHVLKDGVRIFEGTAREVEQWLLTQ